MSVLRLIRQLSDPNVVKNFETIEAFLASKFILDFEFRLLERTFVQNDSRVVIAHGMPFVPKDVIQTSKKGSGAITWLFDEFDRDNLYATITGTSSTSPLIIRALIGSYLEAQ